MRSGQQIKMIIKATDKKLLLKLFKQSLKLNPHLISKALFSLNYMASIFYSPKTKALIPKPIKPLNQNYIKEIKYDQYKIKAKKTQALCQLANMVNNNRICANQKRYIRPNQDKSLPQIMKSSPIDKKSPRILMAINIV